MSQTVTIDGQAWDEKTWKAAWAQGDKNIFDRLIKQSKETNSCLPAESYADAIRCLRKIQRFPHFMPGQTASESTREYFKPLLIDLMHLAHRLADRKKGEDPDDDMDVKDNLDEIEDFFTAINCRLQEARGDTKTSLDIDPGPYSLSIFAKDLERNIDAKKAFSTGVNFGAALAYVVSSDFANNSANALTVYIIGMMQESLGSSRPTKRTPSSKPKKAS